MGLHEIKSDTPTMKHNMRNDHKGLQPVSFSSVYSLKVQNQTI